MMLIAAPVCNPVVFCSLLLYLLALMSLTFCLLRVLFEQFPFPLYFLEFQRRRLHFHSIEFELFFPTNDKVVDAFE